MHGSPEQQEEMLTLFAAKDNLDEEEKVHRVMAIYDAIGLRTIVEEHIDIEFRTAKQYLDAIHAPEEKKAPLRELMETLMGRKK